MITVNKGSFYLSSFWNKMENKPIIFWDTCAILDILRIADRENVNTFNNYLYILEKIENEELISVTSELVLFEYNSNVQDIEQEFRNKQSKAKETIKKYCAFQTNECSTQILNNIDNLDAITTFIAFSEKLWSNTYIIREQKQFQKFAHFRTKHKFAPAHKKGEYKDCYIWGTCLQLAHRKTREIPIFFFTRNSDDYCDINDKTKLDSQILGDCTQNGIAVLLSSGSVRREFHRLGI